MPVLSVERYRALTGDDESRGPDVVTAIADAVAIVEEYLRRKLEAVERTESVRVFPNGSVHPSARPVLSVSGTQTSGLFGTSTRTLTYVGGFTEATLPYTLASVIANIAKALLSDEEYHGDISQVPEGAKSVSVGDVSITFDAPVRGSVTPLSDAHRRALRPYRTRVV